VRFLVLLAAVASCKGAPPAPQDPPPVPAKSGSNAVSPPAPANDDPPVPPSNSKPIAKSAPYSLDTGKKLAELKFPGFELKVRGTTEKGFEVRHLTEKHPKIAVTVSILPCFNCTEMSVEKWKSQTDGLKLLVQPELRDRPETDFEVGEVNLAGTKMIYSYQAGQYFGKDDNGNPIGAYTDAYAVYYNDGVNQIRVVAEFKDDPRATKEDMLALVPRAKIEKLAKGFMDAYAHAW
jgi:hypothetical protein